MAADSEDVCSRTIKLPSYAALERKCAYFFSCSFKPSNASRHSSTKTGAALEIVKSDIFLTVKLKEKFGRTKFWAVPVVVASFGNAQSLSKRDYDLPMAAVNIEPRKGLKIEREG